jgi:hypothetical protein
MKYPNYPCASLLSSSYILSWVSEGRNTVHDTNVIFHSPKIVTTP